ncbi:DUF4062 domain-containing protein [Flavobacterium proteolyticum]|uniref:DUF4062 domain-containing protein n=1 Tax=Flavobacterium proteolyticum TaxID=2911683 RepID=A0ABR9WRQ3_9FLAO|nr:DUF4062 domain-containing protein [Flavobacterium proteolyticum]MBE9576582.1 DUF4062 domain-containing protein [Flavobacterium proteolyticum]
MKRYSVFVSSTYEDLADERKEVIQALLELDCIPIGMEMFPATDDEQWKLIKELIEDCDYYILIIGGRYGSLNNDGISYTQMEYEYAMKIGVPIISFLPKYPDKIIAGKTDKDPIKASKLEEFKKLASEKMVKFWTSPEDLGSVVSRSLVKLIKDKPRIGWVKADKISTSEANIEILELKQKIQELEEELKNKLENDDLTELAQGEDLYKVEYAYKEKGRGNWIIDKVDVKWNVLFSKTCTILIDEAKEEDYKSRIDSYINYILKLKKPNHDEVKVIADSFMSILIQFKALGLIEKSIRKRLLKDGSTYWKLTNKGDHEITKLRAIPKAKKDAK